MHVVHAMRSGSSDLLHVHACAPCGMHACEAFSECSMWVVHACSGRSGVDMSVQLQLDWSLQLRVTGSQSPILARSYTQAT